MFQFISKISFIYIPTKLNNRCYITHITQETIIETSSKSIITYARYHPPAQFGRFETALTYSVSTRQINFSIVRLSLSRKSTTQRPVGCIALHEGDVIFSDFARRIRALIIGRPKVRVLHGERYTFRQYS